jgi:5-methylcytosine-specific restriction endonuclease McrA
MIDDDGTKKGIEIKGKHNRYMVKKIIKKDPTTSLKKTTKEKDLEKEWFSHDFQLQKLIDKNKIIMNEIKNKVLSYKRQDVLKKRLDEEKFITTNHVSDMLLKNNMTCYYCKTNVFILYEKCREETQWSVDRIDNSIGHNVNNIVISCLKCNLQKKTRDSEKFAQTKQLIIKREGID